MGTNRQMNGAICKYSARFFKHREVCSDTRPVARRFTVEWWTGVLVLAVFGWHAAFPAVCFAADPLPVAARNNGAGVERANLLRATESVFQTVPPLLCPPAYPC